MSDTFDLKGAADLLHLSESSLAEMARAGEVPAAKIGKCWLFSRQLLLDWLAEETARQVASRRQPEYGVAVSTEKAQAALAKVRGG